MTSVTTYLTVLSLLVSAPVVLDEPCEGPEVSQWVSDIYSRMQFNLLATFATTTYGELVSCDGAVTDEFDGVSYGHLTLQYPGGVTLRVETMPIETSIQMLERMDGFEDATAVTDAFRASVDEIGVAVNWSEATPLEENGLRVEEFSDPDDGLNAIARFYYRDDTLVRLSFSLAL